MNAPPTTPPVPTGSPAEISMVEQVLSSPTATSIVGLGALAFAWKVLWPILQGFVQNQTTHSRTQSASLEQLSQLVTDAIKRAEDERQIRIKSDEQRDQYFSELVLLRAKLEVALAEIESQKRENANLRYQLDQCRKHHPAPWHPEHMPPSASCGSNDVPIPNEDNNG